MHGTHLEDLTTKIRPRTASNLLLWFVVAFIIAFFVWASLTKLDRTVRGQGRVIPSARLQVISNMEGGVVQEILVHAGQQVHAGDVLIRLDPTASGSELGSGQATVSALQVKIARLEAEIQDREPVYPPTNDPAIADQVRIEQALHASRLANLAGIVGAGQARIGEVTRGVGEAEATYRSRAATYQQRQS